MWSQMAHAAFLSLQSCFDRSTTIEQTNAAEPGEPV